MRGTRLPVTREDFASILLRWLEPLRGRYDVTASRLNVGSTSAQYEDEVVPFEAWARQLFGLVPFWAGGGTSGFFEGIYQRGLVSGTDPESSGYWGDFRDHDQKIIECGAIAYGLLEAPHVLWEPLSEEERGRVARWLAKVDDVSCPEGSWLLFPALVNVALARLGMPYREESIERGLRRVEQYRLSGGWYEDGPTGVPDYYTPFSFYFYGLLCAHALRDVRPEVASRWERGARELAPDFARFFSAKGAAVPYGRSLTYRCAQSAFFSLAVGLGVDLGDGVDLALAKRIVAANVAFWNDSRSFDSGGVLSIGYRHPNLHMAEGYNAPGSPYWALKAFACLTLPAQDPFWELDPNEGLPIPGVGVWQTFGGTALLARDGAGEVTLFPSGRVPGHPFAQSDAKYSKFVYSSRFGFSVARSQRTLAETAPDSMLAFVAHGHVFVRDGVEDAWVEDGTVVSRWSPLPGIEVESRVTPVEGGHVRRHVVRSAIECEAYDCGFAVPGDYHELGLTDVERACRVRAAGAVPGEPMLIAPEANTNLMCGKTLIPAVRYHVGVGESRLVTEVLLG